jgi:hypothetical protein
MDAKSALRLRITGNAAGVSGSQLYSQYAPGGGNSAQLGETLGMDGPRTGFGGVWPGLVREILAHSCDCPARYGGFVIYGWLKEFSLLM